MTESMTDREVAYRESIDAVDKAADDVRLMAERIDTYQGRDADEYARQAALRGDAVTLDGISEALECGRLRDAAWGVAELSVHCYDIAREALPPFLRAGLYKE